MKRLIRKASNHKLEFEILYGFSNEMELPKKWSSKNDMAKELAEYILNQDAGDDYLDKRLDIEELVDKETYDRLSQYQFRELGFKEDYPESGEVISSVVTELRVDLSKFVISYNVSDESLADKCQKDLLDELSNVFGILDYSEPDGYLTQIDNMYITFALKLK